MSSPTNVVNNKISENGTKPEEEGRKKNVVPKENNKDEDETDELLRGDAIGDTLYSERFVLKTLLKLRQVESDFQLDEDFEKDLETLWDMTTENDVIAFLLEMDIYEVFTQCIKTTEDKRLIEIIVGIIANMSVSKAHIGKEFYKNDDAFHTIFSLMSCTDTCTLVQLMRLLRDCHSTSEQDFEALFDLIGKQPDFIEDLSSILMNSTNCELLETTLGALNAMLITYANFIEDDADFINFFIKECLIRSTLEAFQTLYSSDDRQNDDRRDFLSIHQILIQYGEKARNFYEITCSNEIKMCLRTIVNECFEFLEPLAAKEYLIIEGMTDFLSAFQSFFDAEIMDKAVEMLRITERQSGLLKSDDSFEEDNDMKHNIETFSKHLIEFINVLLSLSSQDDLQSVFEQLTKEKLVVLMEKLGIDYNKEDDKPDKYIKALLNFCSTVQTANACSSIEQETI